MATIYSDPSLYCNGIENGIIYGIYWIYVAIIRTGDQYFRKQSKGTHSRIYMSSMTAFLESSLMSTSTVIHRKDPSWIKIPTSPILRPYKQMYTSATFVPPACNLHGYLTIDHAFLVPFRLFYKSFWQISTPDIQNWSRWSTSFFFKKVKPSTGSL